MALLCAAMKRTRTANLSSQMIGSLPTATKTNVLNTCSGEDLGVIAGLSRSDTDLSTARRSVVEPGFMDAASKGDATTSTPIVRLGQRLVSQMLPEVEVVDGCGYARTFGRQARHGLDDRPLMKA